MILTILLILIILIIILSLTIKILYLTIFKINVIKKELLNSTDLSNKVIIVTGANSGCGFENCKILSSLGKNMTIILGCRNPEKAKQAIKKLKSENKTNCNFEFIKIDLNDLESIQKFSKTFKSKYTQLDILICNAGVMPNSHQITKQGVEVLFGVNTLGHFLLIKLLEPIILNTPNSRVTLLGSMIHRLFWNYSYKENDIIGKCSNILPTKLYARSKLGNMLLAKKFQRHFDKLKPNNNTIVCSCCPGAVDTRITRDFDLILNPVSFLITYLLKSPFEGAQTATYCSIEKKEKLKKGGYYAGCMIDNESKTAKNEKLIDDCWNICNRISEKYLK